MHTLHSKNNLSLNSSRSKMKIILKLILSSRVYTLVSPPPATAQKGACVCGGSSTVQYTIYSSLPQGLSLSRYEYATPIPNCRWFASLWQLSFCCCACNWSKQFAKQTNTIHITCVHRACIYHWHSYIQYIVHFEQLLDINTVIFKIIDQLTFDLSKKL